MVLKQLKLSVIVLSSLLLGSAFVKPASCDPEALRAKMAPALRGYSFVKSFDVETNGDALKKEYSYVLSKDVAYTIVAADNNEKGKKLIVNLFDRNKKIIASNYNKSRKEFLPAIEYQCEATGVYYLETFFQNEEKSCGLVVLAYKK